MSRPILLASLFMIGSAATAACSSDETPGASDAGAGGSADSGPGTGGKGGSGGKSGSSGMAGGGGMAPTDAGDAGMKVKVAGTVVVAIPGKNGHEDPLPGASVCVTDKAGDKITSIPCVTTGASGAFEFSLSSGTRVVIEFEKAGYGSQLIAVDVGTADIARGDVRLSPPASGDAGDAGNGPTYGWDPSVVIDPAKGLVNLIAVQPSGSPDAGAAAPGLDFTTGLTLSVSPKSGVGPYYVAPDETWASSATTTVGGYGAWFLNLTPGEYKASASSPDLDCVPIGSNGYGWPNTDGTSGFPIIAGFNTQSIGFYCVPKVSDAGHD